MKRKLVCLAMAVAVLSACARSAPLPGDSVPRTGAIRVAPPRASATSQQSSEPLGDIESRVFPVELVMEHQSELAITPAQRDAILAETDHGDTEMLHVRWDLESQRSALAAALDADRVDEAHAMQIAAQLMADEDRIKTLHLAMLIRIKNALTPAQQRQLRAWRR